MGIRDNVGLVEMKGYFMSFVRTDSQGNVLWHQAYENQTELVKGRQVNKHSVTSVLQTSDGGFILGGSKKGYDNGFYTAAWLMKTDSDGNRLWIKYYRNEGDDDGYINSIEKVMEMGPDNFLFVGLSEGAIIAKTDSMGNIQWTKTYNSSIRFHSMLKTKRGDFVFAGYQGDFEEYETTACVMKLDVVFNTVCYWKYENYSGLSIEDSEDDGYLFTNRVNYGNSLIKTDLEGNVEWTCKSNGWIQSAIRTEDGKYVLTGKITHPEPDKSEDGTYIMVESIALNPTIETGQHTEIISTDLTAAAFVITVVIGAGITVIFILKERKR
jgi:hypothetical protein